MLVDSFSVDDSFISRIIHLLEIFIIYFSFQFSFPLLRGSIYDMLLSISLCWFRTPVLKARHTRRFRTPIKPISENRLVRSFLRGRFR